jgi:predicted nucleic acid-binding protein
MPVEKIVLNASPLILLCNGELSFVLPALFPEIVVPEAVWQEITNGSHLDRAARMLPELNWLKQKRVAPVPDIVRWDLGLGETEVLSFAVKHGHYTPVLDDMLAKKCARSLGLPTIGTGTILILAKERGLIESVEQSLRKLQNAGLWISEPVIQLVKRKAGEY